MPVDYSSVRGYRVKYITSQTIHADGTTEKGNNVVGYIVSGPFKHTPELIISTTSLPDGKAYSAYSYAVTATGGDGNYTWSAEGLPPGLEIETISGTVTGTPTQAGEYNPVITVTSVGLSESATFEFNIQSLNLSTPRVLANLGNLDNYPNEARPESMVYDEGRRTLVLVPQHINVTGTIKETADGINFSQPISGDFRAFIKKENGFFYSGRGNPALLRWTTLNNISGINPGFTGNNWVVTAFYNEDDNILYLGRYAAEGMWLYKSTDNGLTWTQDISIALGAASMYGPVYRTEYISALQKLFYVFGGNYANSSTTPLLYSRDRDLSNPAQRLSGCINFVWSKRLQKLICGGVNNTVYISDDGITFTGQRLDNNKANGFSLVYNHNDIFYFIADNQKIYASTNLQDWNLIYTASSTSIFRHAGFLPELNRLIFIQANGTVIGIDII